MPLLYGEEDKAFLRLQEQIAAKSTDHTLFVWNMDVTGTLTKDSVTKPSHENDNISEITVNTKNAPFFMNFLNIHKSGNFFSSFSS